ncbi:MAG: hypothetical protein R3C24_06440 [Cyanobacteriota/Melainabacteria group bacterium]
MYSRFSSAEAEQEGRQPAALNKLDSPPARVPSRVLEHHRMFSFVHV